MTKLCLLLGVCLVLTVVAAQTCTKIAVEKFFQCEEENMKKGMEEMKKFKEEELARCFIKHKCDPCEEEMEHHEHGSGSGMHGHMTCEEIIKDEECREAVFEKEHEKLAACVKKDTGFVLPEAHKRSRGEHHHMEGSGHGSGEHHGSGMFEEKLKKSCGNNATKEADVKECVEKLRAPAMKELNGLCVARNKCMTAFEAAHCTKANITATFNTLKEAKKTCMTKPTLEQLEQLAKGASPCHGLKNLTRVFEHHHMMEHHEGSGEHSGMGSGEEHHNPMDEMCWKVEHEKPATSG